LSGSRFLCPKGREHISEVSGANGFDDSGEIVAHHDRERIVADDLQRAGARLEINGVKAGGLNSDEESTNSRRRLWHVG
jgi:hypothetical protein